MTGALLRTGSLDVFHPLGAEGNPVHAAAAQIRAAIARRLGPDAADTFAVPQRNEDGDTIDWYAPYPGPVVPWSSASEAERASAKQRLEEVRERVEGLGRQMAAEPDPQRQVFARLLAHVCTFPGEGHVYLVGDRPVITFWGFRHLDAPAYSGAMLNLDALRAGDQQRQGIPWWRWLIGLLVVLTLVFLLLRRCVGEPTPTPGDGQIRHGDLAGEGLAPAAPPEGLHVPPEQLQESSPPDLARPEEPPFADVGLRHPDSRHSEVLNLDSERIYKDRILRDGVSQAVEIGPDPVVDGLRSEQVADVLDEGAVVKDSLLIEHGPVPATGETLPGDFLVPGDTATPADPVLVPEGAEGAEGIDENPIEETGVPVDDLERDRTEIGDEAPVEPAPDGMAPEIGQDPSPLSETGLNPPADQPEKGTAEGLLSPDSAPAPAVAGDDAGTVDGEPLPGGGVSTDGAAAPTVQPSAPGASGPGRGQLQPMTIPAQALRTGSVRFADGGWRTSTSLQDARGLPVDMRYRLADGRGRVELQRYDGSVCAADVQAAMRDGKLVIDSAAEITCPDGTSFGRPSMECKPGEDGRADCAGRYPTGESFSVDIGKAP